jgi:quercetin dioxygenase-like cupin family protein
MNRLLSLVALTCLLAVAALAQDPLKVAPNNYKLEFENDWVKVVRVHYGPNEKIVAHDHNPTAAAYVYLSDSGPVIFKHINLSYGAITRAAVKAGSFRVYKSVKEVHEVENPNDTPSDFLRVEFKTEPLGDNKLRGKFFREETPAGENFSKVQFDNEQVRITRLIVAAGKSAEVSATTAEPTLLIALTPARLKAKNAKGKTSKLNLETGKAGWLPIGEKRQFENVGDSATELLRFDFKTKPIKPNPSEKEKPHSHPHD